MKSIGVAFSPRASRPSDGSLDANLPAKFQKLPATQPKVYVSGVGSVIPPWSTTTAVYGSTLDCRYADRPPQMVRVRATTRRRSEVDTGKATAKVPHDQSCSNVQSG